MNRLFPATGFPVRHLCGGIAMAYLLSVHVPQATAQTVTGIYSGTVGKSQQGTASWHEGTGRTASGERWVSEDFVAAHRSLPLGSRVRVVNLKNGRSTIVRITDRGPYARGRVIDLSRAAAREIGLLESGIGKVRLETVPAGVNALSPESKPSA